MQQFIEKYRERIAGVLAGVDPLVLRGSLRRLNYGWWDESLGAVVAEGMEQDLWRNQILCKDYQQHVKRWSERVKDAGLNGTLETDFKRRPERRTRQIPEEWQLGQVLRQSVRNKNLAVQPSGCV